MTLEIVPIRSQIVKVVEVAGRKFDVLSWMQVTASGEPQLPQKREAGGLSAPQFEQWVTSPA